MAVAVIERHNKQVLEELEPGDLIEFNRGMYSHWAVFVGDEEVIHLAGDENDGINANIGSGTMFTICGRQFSKAFVRKDNFWTVVCGSKAKKNNGKDRKLKPGDRQEILERALSKIGHIGYNVLWKNCEHFASWCRYGCEWSEQADKFLTWAAVGTGIATLAAIVVGSSRAKQKQKQPA